LLHPPFAVYFLRIYQGFSQDVPRPVICLHTLFFLAIFMPLFSTFFAPSKLPAINHRKIGKKSPAVPYS